MSDQGLERDDREWTVISGLPARSTPILLRGPQIPAGTEITVVAKADSRQTPTGWGEVLQCLLWLIDRDEIEARGWSTDAIDAAEAMLRDPERPDNKRLSLGQDLSDAGDRIVELEEALFLLAITREPMLMDEEEEHDEIKALRERGLFLAVEIGDTCDNELTPQGIQFLRDARADHPKEQALAARDIKRPDDQPVDLMARLQRSLKPEPLTADEHKAIRCALEFGVPPGSDPLLKSAKAKLRRQEASAGQEAER